eukprot:2954595-Rhodomonas_salina.2
MSGIGLVSLLRTRYAMSGIDLVRRATRASAAPRSQASFRAVRCPRMARAATAYSVCDVPYWPRMWCAVCGTDIACDATVRY